jgi:DNA replicative helicase MCM subunit Mcm2 (Cdc46/Mcm family)
LIKDLSDVEHANGFSNRFLWLCVRRSGILPFGEDFQIMKFRPLIDRLGESIELAKIAGQITWATATRSLWETVYPDLSEGRLGVIGAITARAEAQVVRLACIYALLDCSTEIEPDHLKAALAIWSYAEDSVRYIFSTSASNPLAKKIYEILLKHPQGIGRREINNALGRNYSADRIDDALDTLKASGIANSRKVQTEERPVEQWFSIQNKDELNE